MTPSHKKQNYKFKPGNLVRHRYKNRQPDLGIGIIVESVQSDFGPAYWVYWIKTGLRWNHEKYLIKVFK